MSNNKKKITVILNNGDEITYVADRVDHSRYDTGVFVEISNRIFSHTSTWTEGHLWWKRKRTSDVHDTQIVALVKEALINRIEIEEGKILPP